MTTLDTLALQRSDMMLRDQHYRINMTRPNIASFRRISSELISVVIYVLQSHLVTSLKVFFHDVGDTHALVRLRSLMLQPECSTCPLSRRTLPMTGNGVTRFV
jgi:hypothetical protein